MTRPNLKKIERDEREGERVSFGRKSLVTREVIYERALPEKLVPPKAKSSSTSPLNNSARVCPGRATRVVNVLTVCRVFFLQTNKRLFCALHSAHHAGEPRIDCTGILVLQLSPFTATASGISLT